MGLPQASALNAPARILYQGQLTQSGLPFTGIVPMIFNIKDISGATRLWTSGPVNVKVANGRFTYPLGTPNEADFARIDWFAATPHVEIIANGLALLPREPLLDVPYALLAKGLAPGAPITAPTNPTDAANKSYVDTSVANTGWGRSSGHIYTLIAANVGIGTDAPAAKLEVQGGPIKATGGLILQIFDASNPTAPRPTAPGSIWLEQ